MNESDMVNASAPPPSMDASTRRRWLLAAMAGSGALVLGAGGYAWWQQRSEAHSLHASLDDLLWSQNFARPDGEALPMRSLLGKPLILNFWATWCPPCVVELPLLNRFYTERQTQGWQVLGLAMDKPEAVRQFLTKLPLAFPVAMAGEQGTSLARALGNLQGGLPFTVVFDAKGQVSHRKIGQIKEEDLARWAA